MSDTTGQSTATRRGVLKAAAAAATAMAIPRAVHAAGSDLLKVGLVGCGGRGTGAAGQALNADRNVVLTAIGDAFEDRVKSSLESLRKRAPDKVKVDADHCFVGLDAYKRVIDSGIDVVVLTTPPGFRPAHIKYAVEKGKHIFCEKPMAVDAPGVKVALDAVEEARKKNLAIVSGFCWRYSYPERAVFEKVREGAIGDIVAVYGTYYTGFLWSHPRRPEYTDVQWQVRNWLYFTWLSGDHIVEQAVHTIDKIAWAMGDRPPLRAVGTGGRQVRTDPQFGHIFDHFAIVYEWPDGVRGFHYTRQQGNTAGDVSDYILGTKGIASVLGSPSHAVRVGGKNVWRYDGPRNDMYQTEHDELFASIRAGKPINDGPRMMNSTMMAIMGRMAAYTGQVVTWEQATNSRENLVPENLDWNTPMPVAPVARPGVTKLI